MGNGPRSRTQRLQGGLWRLRMQPNAVLLIDHGALRRGAAVADKPLHKR